MAVDRGEGTAYTARKRRAVSVAAARWPQARSGGRLQQLWPSRWMRLFAEYCGLRCWPRGWTRWSSCGSCSTLATLVGARRRSMAPPSQRRRGPRIIDRAECAHRRQVGSYRGEKLIGHGCATLPGSVRRGAGEQHGAEQGGSGFDWSRRLPPRPCWPGMSRHLVGGMVSPAAARRPHGLRLAAKWRRRARTAYEGGSIMSASATSAYSAAHLADYEALVASTGFYELAGSFSGRCSRRCTAPGEARMRAGSAQNRWSHWMRLIPGSMAAA